MTGAGPHDKQDRRDAERIRWLFDHIDRTGMDPWKHQLRPPMVDETGNDWMTFDEFVAAIDSASGKGVGNG